MRGDDRDTGYMFSYLSPEERVPADHPLRTIRRMTDAIFDRLSPQFDRLYSTMGRPSIPPEKLLRALLLQGLYTVRSERLLIEQLRLQPPVSLVRRAQHGRPGVGCDDVHEKSRPPARGGRRGGVLCGNPGGSRDGGSASRMSISRSMARCWRRGRVRRASVAGTRPADPPDDPGNPTVNFRGEARTNDTHHSTTDPDARLYRKSSGSEARLAYLGHLLIENRHGLIVDAVRHHWRPAPPNARRR